MEVLLGVSQFFTERGYYVLHYLDDPIPHIRIHSHKVDGCVECQASDNHLGLTYRRHIRNTSLETVRQSGKTVSNTSPFMWTGGTKTGSRIIDLNRPTALTEALLYARKHLSKRTDLKGGLNAQTNAPLIETPDSKQCLSLPQNRT